MLTMASSCSSYIATSNILWILIITQCPNLNFSDSTSSLNTLPLDGHLEFENIRFASKDFGNRFHRLPLVVLHPKSVTDIATTVKHIWNEGPLADLTVAARGHGHSLQGQAQADQGVVINMESLQEHHAMKVHTEESPYIDVSGGELWINVLKESLKYGLTPKSWTDYLHLTVGGTLSNGGISGQAFRHGPQISNVIKLQVVTGTGEVVNCSDTQNTDLFYAVLGGLGQFGIITQARISLEPAPLMVRWIRVLYFDFTTFKRDQEHLIMSSHNTFDYVEGFVIMNTTGLLNNWRSSFNVQDSVRADQFKSDGRILYCLELAKYFSEAEEINEEVEEMLSGLSYVRSTRFVSEVPYKAFLDRVHESEMKLRSKGLWDIPHPWLNLLIPGSQIQSFAEGVFGTILKNSINGPILIYPMHRSKWDNRSSAVIPEEDVFYLVAFLSSSDSDGLEHILSLNKKIIEYCQVSNVRAKQYLPHYTTNEEWRNHFGSKWEAFVQRKLAYDPFAILAPGQSIFRKAVSYI